MAQRDLIHQAVKNALIADGWVITHDPLRLKYGKRHIEIDLAAESLLTATRGTVQIAVEVKSFVGNSIINDLKTMIGSYQVYRPLVAKLAAQYKLYVAIPQSIYDEYFDEPLIALAVEANAVPLFVVNIAREEIVQWIN